MEVTRGNVFQRCPGNALAAPSAEKSTTTTTAYRENIEKYILINCCITLVINSQDLRTSVTSLCQRKIKQFIASNAVKSMSLWRIYAKEIANDAETGVKNGGIMSIDVVVVVVVDVTSMWEARI